MSISNTHRWKRLAIASATAIERFSIELLEALILIYTGLLSIYFTLRRKHDKLFEEWSRDPPMKSVKKSRFRIKLEAEDLPAIISGPLAILVMLIVWFL